MSAFVGAVLLDNRGGALPVDLRLPDEPGLDRPRQTTSGCAVLVHRQRVVTPQDRNERQPWRVWDGAGWVAFAGRLDDRSGLAAALDLGHGDRITDGELAGGAIERWGKDGFSRLLGDYAVAAWHGGTRELMLAGDPMGMRSIYYWWQPGIAVFSTTLPGLLAVTMVPRALNEPFLADFLAMNLGDEESTFYRDIRKVHPGTSVVVTAAGVRSHEFHRFDAGRRLRLADDGSYVEAAREILNRAVADRQRAIAPVPISASGGLDSACMVVSALSSVGSLTLLTSVPESGLPAPVGAMSYVSETSQVEILAGAFPGVHTESLEPTAAIGWSPDSPLVIGTGATPLRGPGQIAWFDAVPRRAASLGARSLLVGALGNFTVSWNGRQTLADLLSRGRWVTLARELVTGSGGNPRQFAGLIKGTVEPFLPRDFSAASLTSQSALHPDALRSMGVLERMKSRGNDARFVFTRDHRSWRIHAMLRNRSRRPEGMNLGRALYGIDAAAPLGDVRLVEFCLAIPGDQFLRNGRSRWLARRLLRAAGVPPAIADSERRGLQHPEWFAHITSVRPLLTAQIARLRQSPMAARLIDLDRLDRLVLDWPKDAAAAARRAGLFRAVLPRALHVGAFIAWAEERATEPARPGPGLD